jgi:protein-tyrosine kinase
MSRIHEALKKAEQDRSAGHASDAAAPRQEPPEPNPAPAAIESQPPTPIENAPRNVQAPALQTTEPQTTAAIATASTELETIRDTCAQPQWHPDPRQNIFLDAKLGAHAAEQFRTLRSKLYEIRATKNLRTVLVTSAIPQEGKTWVTNNLAQAIVRQADRRALIIDADLRASRLHVSLGAPSLPGLTDYLKGEAEENAIIQHGAGGNLYFIPGGNKVPNPSELLSNGRMKTLLERVSPMFDWVILDSPPWFSVADAGILAGLCDGILLVVRSGVTPSAVAEKAQLELKGRNVIGIVLNAADESGLYGSHSYYKHDNNGLEQRRSKESSNGNAAGKSKIPL